MEAQDTRLERTSRITWSSLLWQKHTPGKMTQHPIRQILLFQHWGIQHFPGDIPRAGCSHCEISTQLLQVLQLTSIQGSLPHRTWLLPPFVSHLQKCPVQPCTAPASNLKSSMRKEGKTNTQLCFLVIINIFIVKNTIK